MLLLPEQTSPFSSQVASLILQLSARSRRNAILDRKNYQLIPDLRQVGKFGGLPSVTLPPCSRVQPETQGRNPASSQVAAESQPVYYTCFFLGELVLTNNSVSCSEADKKGRWRGGSPRAERCGCNSGRGAGECGIHASCRLWMSALQGACIFQCIAKFGRFLETTCQFDLGGTASRQARMTASNRERMSMLL